MGSDGEGKKDRGGRTSRRKKINGRRGFVTPKIFDEIDSLRSNWRRMIAVEGELGTG